MQYINVVGQYWWSSKWVLAKTIYSDVDDRNFSQKQKVTTPKSKEQKVTKRRYLGISIEEMFFYTKFTSLTDRTV